MICTKPFDCGKFECFDCGWAQDDEPPLSDFDPETCDPFDIDDPAPM